MTATRSNAQPATATGIAGAEDTRPRDDLAAVARSVPSGLPQLMRIVGAVAAPTTALTSILFYFGWSFAYYFYAYLGVDSSVLGLTTRDYIQFNVDALFIPLAVIACAAAIVLWVRSLLRLHVAPESHPFLGRMLAPVLAVAGLTLTANGLSRLFAETALNNGLAVAPLCLGLGISLLMYALHRHRSRTLDRQEGRGPTRIGIAEWAVVFVLVGLSLFWAANDYSAAVGSSRARQLVAELPTYPDAVIYSARSLSLHAPGVRETACRDPKAAYLYRYDGLKLVLRSDNQYLFLPTQWSRTNGVAILIPRNDDSLRIEFMPTGAAQAGTAEAGAAEAGTDRPTPSC